MSVEGYSFWGQFFIQLINEFCIKLLNTLIKLLKLKFLHLVKPKKKDFEHPSILYKQYPKSANMKPNSQIFWRNDSLVSMKWSWRTCKQGRCRDFSKDTAPPPPRLQVESLPFKTIQKLFWWKYSLVKSWDFFPPPPLAKMLQYLVGGKVDAAQATFSKLYQIIYGTLLTYLSISLYYPFGKPFSKPYSY